MISKAQIQANIDGFLEPFKKTWYEIVLHEAREYISNPEIKIFNADVLNNLILNGGSVNGIVFRTLRKEGRLRKIGYINSQRTVAHHREIPNYEVRHKCVNIGQE